MRNVSTYSNLTMDELKEELVTVSAVLSAEYESLGMALADYHRDFLNDYASAPESSAAAKNRVAAYANQVAGSEIITVRARINALVLCRDLLVFLAGGQAPPTPPENMATMGMDDDGLPVV
jgi:hypothetical protein